jgi:nitroreductase
MELAEALRRRRMVRSFSGRPPDPDLVDRLLAGATSAPSAGDTRGWDAVVMAGPAETALFWEATTTEQWRERSRRWVGMSRAPVVVAFFADPLAYVARYQEPDKAAGSQPVSEPMGSARTSLSEGIEAWPVPYWFVDVGFAVMALLLGVADAGLGACFLGNFRGEAALCEALGIPDGRRYVGAVLLGEPGGDDPASASLGRTRRPRPTMLHRGRW